MATEYRVGTIVTHPKCPEWGPGRVLEVKGTKVTVYFRDIRGESLADAVRSIRVDLVPLSLSGQQSDPALDNLPPFSAGEFARLPRKRVTLAEGIERFHMLFPLYFRDPQYIGGSGDGERTYKVAAHELFVRTLGDGHLAALIESGDFDEIRRRGLAVESRVNLLSPFERIAFRDGLRETRVVERFFRALEYLLRGSRVDRERFEQFVGAVQEIPSEDGKSDPAKWTVATLLPFLADPVRFMFLKPTVTKDCAALLAFDIRYSPDLNWTTYSKVMEMSAYLLDELREYGARDFIDVQSFIWIIGRGWNYGA